MEGDGDDKEHNGGVAITALLEESANEGEIIFSKSVDSERGNNLFVQDGYLICNKKNCTPEMTLLDPEIGVVKKIIEKCSDKIILESFNENESPSLLPSTYSDCESLQSDSSEVCSNGGLSVDSGIATGPLSSRDVLRYKKVHLDSSVNNVQPQNKMLSDQADVKFDTSHINSTSSKESETTNTPGLPRTASYMKGLSSSDDGEITDLELEDNPGSHGCQNGDLDCNHRTTFESVSSDELPELVCVVASHVQSLLRKELDLSACEYDASHINDNGRTLVDSSITFDASKVSSGYSGSSDVNIEAHGKSNDSSSLVTQSRLGSTTLQLASLETERVLGETHASPQWAESGKLEDIHSPINSSYFSLFPEKTAELVETVSLSDDSSNRVVEAVSDDGGNKVVEGRSITNNSNNKDQEMPTNCESVPANHPNGNIFSESRCSDEENNTVIDLSQQKSLDISVDSSGLREINNVETVPGEDSNLNNGENLTIELSEDGCVENISRESSCAGTRTMNNDTATDKRQATSDLIDLENISRESSCAGTRTMNNDTATDKRQATSDLIDLENISRESSCAGTRTMNNDTATDKRRAPSDFIDLHDELDFEEDVNDKRAEVTVAPVEVNGEVAKHEEGESSDKDEGELSDDDVEEGEIKEPGSKKSLVKSVCPFFQKGSCTWGVSCRFLHPGINDKGNYQMIEVPGYRSPASRARVDTACLWPKLPEEQVTLPHKVLEVPSTETAWERGLRLAKEQKKKAIERKEQGSAFENKQQDKESEQIPKLIPRVPYYDQPAYEEDVYYKSPRDLLQPTHYEDFQGRHNQHNSYAQPYRESHLGMPSAQYVSAYNQLEKFDRNGLDQREQFRAGGAPPHLRGYTPPPLKRPDEWTDPWMRSRSPQHLKDKKQSLSRGRRRRRHRSKSDSSHSSRSSSGSSSSSSRSSRSNSSSSSSRERSRDAVSLKGPGGYDSGYHKSGSTSYQPRGGNYGGGNTGPGIVFAGRNVRNRSRDRFGRKNGRYTPDRPLPYARPRRRSGSSCSDSGRSRSRSRRRKPSRGSSRSGSSSSSSAALGSPSKNIRGSTATKMNKSKSHSTVKRPQVPQQAASQNHQDSLPYPPFSLDQIPHPNDPKPPLPNPPMTESVTIKTSQVSLKAKDPQKPAGHKSSVKLTILPKQPALDSRPNPLDSPPLKRRLSDDDVIVVSAVPAKIVILPTTPPSAQRLKSDRTRKIKSKTNKETAQLSIPHQVQSSLSSAPGSKTSRGLLKQQSSNTKSKTVVTKSSVKSPLASSALAATTTKAKPMKNRPISRKELLKQLKEVEDAIARKKSQLQ